MLNLKQVWQLQSAQEEDERAHCQPDYRKLWNFAPDEE